MDLFGAYGNQISTPNQKLFEVGDSGIPSHLSALGFKTADEVNDKIIDAMYASTQDYLKAKRITELTLYRGVKFEAGTTKAPKWSTGGTVRIESNAISSWSLNEDKANSMFGAGGVTTFSTKGEWGATFKMTVPADRVFSTAITGDGCFSEWEVILFGNEWDEAYIQNFEVSR
jgi:hypothetical protein